MCISAFLIFLNESHFSSSWSEQSISLNRLFFSMFSFTFFRLSCFLCMDSFFIFSSSLSSPLYATSSFSRKISRARFLFKSTDLVWWHFTTIPVGMCLSTTQLLVLLVACPPGPDPRTNCSSRSSSCKTGRSIWYFLPAAKTNGHPINLQWRGGENNVMCPMFIIPNFNFQTEKSRWPTKVILQSFPL